MVMVQLTARSSCCLLCRTAPHCGWLERLLLACIRRAARGARWLVGDTLATMSSGNPGRCGAVRGDGGRWPAPPLCCRALSSDGPVSAIIAALCRNQAWRRSPVPVLRPAQSAQSSRRIAVSLCRWMREPPRARRTPAAHRVRRDEGRCGGRRHKFTVTGACLRAGQMAPRPRGCRPRHGTAAGDPGGGRHDEDGGVHGC